MEGTFEIRKAESGKIFCDLGVSAVKTYAALPGLAFRSWKAPAPTGSGAWLRYFAPLGRGGWGLGGRIKMKLNIED